jgi:hypothetical protein
MLGKREGHDTGLAGVTPRQPAPTRTARGRATATSAARLKPQLLDIDQTTTLGMRLHTSKTAGMDRIEWLLVGIIVGLAVLAILALFTERLPF